MQEKELKYKEGDILLFGASVYTGTAKVIEIDHSSNFDYICKIIECFENPTVNGDVIGFYQYELEIPKTSCKRKQ